MEFTIMFDLMWQITSLAIVDAVNPCTLTVQALLLSALVITKGKRDALIGGFLFTGTIYFMYLFYGLGILQALYALGIESILRIVLKILLGIMVIMELSAFFSYKPGFRALEMPIKLRPYAKKLLASVENPYTAVPVAALCSVLLLPCSSGPYLSALILLAQTSLKKVLILLYYNLIFVLPMVGITLLVAFGTSPQRVLEWKEKHIKKLHLFAGILLLAVLIMV
jgi:cytochrome c biogenesis protein CcdA